MLSCGLVGVSIVFGTSVTGDRDSVQNELELVLTPAGVAPNVCETLAPRLGRRLREAPPGTRVYMHVGDLFKPAEVFKLEDWRKDKDDVSFTKT
jgi:hypothetical protein